MAEITTFEDAEQALDQYRANAQVPYTLDTMRQLMDYFGNPQEQFKTVHIAGTSGKTSTAYYTSALLTAAGFKTGLTVSPQIEHLNERLQINTQPIPEAEYCATLHEFLKQVNASKLKPSYFEVLVALAYWEFARQGVEYVVAEVGLGGLLDGTNVIQRADKLAVITDIGFDHTGILGNTLGEIATQKAGIIHAGNEVFMYQQSPEIMSSVTAAVTACGARMHIVDTAQADPIIEALPLFQQRNFHLAHRVVDFVGTRESKQLSAHMLAAATQTVVPARMETIQVGEKTVILDGGHNQQKLHALADTLHVKYSKEQIAVLVAISDGDDKRLQGAIDELATLSHNFIVTSFQTQSDYVKHSVDTATIKTMLETHDCHVQIVQDPQEAYHALLAQAEPVLLVTGSLYLLNHIRPLVERS